MTPEFRTSFDPCAAGEKPCATKQSSSSSEPRLKLKPFVFRPRRFNWIAAATVVALVLISLEGEDSSRTAVLPRTSEGLAKAWRILGIPPGSSEAVRKKAKREQMRKVHPDVTGDDGSKLQELLDACDLLDNPQTINDRQAPKQSPSGARRPSTAGDSFLDEWVSQLPKSAPGFRNLNGYPAPTATREWYVALTNVRVRSDPNEDSAATGAVIKQGAVVEVDGELIMPSSYLGGMKSQKFLKLQNPPGWVFVNGISGEWQGRMIFQKSSR